MMAIIGSYLDYTATVALLSPDTNPGVLVSRLSIPCMRTPWCSFECQMAVWAYLVESSRCD